MNGCPVHGYDIAPEACAFCSSMVLAFKMLNDETLPEGRPPDRIDSETRELDGGAVLINYKPVWFDA